MGRNGSQKLDFREPGSTRTSHNLNHWEGNSKVLMQYSLPVKLWDEPQLFRGIHKNTLDMEANFIQKSSSSGSVCGWGRFKSLCHSEIHLDLHTAEWSTRQMLDSGHFWRPALKEEHQIAKSRLLHTNTAEDRNNKRLSLLHSLNCMTWSM